MIGSYGAGRTTMLFQMKFGEFVTTNPTVGFHNEAISYKGNSLSMWDCRGCDKVSQLWPRYYDGMDALIVVVGGHWKDDILEKQPRIASAMAICEAQDIPVLIYNNGSDSDNHLTNQEVSDILKLHEQRGRFHVQESCAVTGEGLWEGIDWLVDAWAGRISSSSSNLAVIVLEVHAAELDAHTWSLSCTNMAGVEVAALKADIQTTSVGELWETLADRLNVPWRMVRLLLPRGKLVYDADRHSALAEALDSRASATRGKPSSSPEPRSVTEFLSGLSCSAVAYN